MYVVPQTYSYGGDDAKMLPAGGFARVSEVDKDDIVTWDFGQPASEFYPYSIRANGLFDEAGEKGVPPCRITAEITALPIGRPPHERLDAKVKPIATAKPATLHSSLDGMRVPPEGVTISYDCGVVRTTGQVVGCRQLGARGHDLEFRAGLLRLREYKFDPKHLDPDNDVPLRADITVILKPSERDPKLAASAPATAVWYSTATAADFSRYYPTKALDQEIEARVIATCLVEADLTLTCGGIRSEPAGITVFDDAVRKLIKHYRAAPLLRNDKPAAGATVEIPILFKLE